MPDLLIELFSEEIPARMQAQAAADLKRLVTDGLVAAGLTYASAGAFATPRRLALSVEGLAAESATVKEERKGPRCDAPEAAVLGFVRSAGVTREQLVARETGKGAVWFAQVVRPGRPAAAIVADVLEAAVRGFPWPKSMRWGEGGLRWVRPLHSVLCLLTSEAGAEVVPVVIDGIVAGDTTEGHRFMAPGRFRVTSFDDYRAKLRRAFVVLDPAERAQAIWHDATTLAFAQGLELVEDPVLLAEVAGLVEWPVVLMGQIGAEFLSLPAEVLQTSMRAHQKFFSVKNPRTGRIERYITVANRETADHGATILHGNGKVLRARLSDARFFYDNDLRVAKAGMGEWLEGLEKVTFIAGKSESQYSDTQLSRLAAADAQKLGSQRERIRRIEIGSAYLGSKVGADPNQCEQAARIAKADLHSAMVKEFPELQGTMGAYYAKFAGYSDDLARVCSGHYAPLGPTDESPRAPITVAVALADKLDILFAFWAIGEKPTGSKDPFALRRAALGLLRTVLDNQLRISLRETIEHWLTILVQEKLEKYNLVVTQTRVGTLTRLNKVSKEWPANHGQAWTQIWFSNVDNPDNALRLDKSVSPFEVQRSTLPVNNPSRFTLDLLSFLHDRLKVYLRDRGIRHDVIDACLAMPANDDLTLLVKRAEALAGFLKTGDGTNLLLGFKRANNILVQAEARDGVEYSYGPDIKFAEEPSEKALFFALDAAEATIAPAMEREDFAAAMAAMAGLRPAVDAFFEAVLINAENQVIRRNRLNLLARIRATCLAVADLTKIEG